MSKSFLIGNFLPAYGGSFGRRRSTGKTLEGLPAERLARRFDERAKQYRARNRSYVQRLEIGLIVALMVTAGAFRVNWTPDQVETIALSEQELVAMEEILQTVQVEKPPPPPRPPVPVEVPDDVVLDDVELDLDATLDMELALADLPPPPPTPAEVVEEEPEPEIFMVVEDPPQMVGGMAALVEDLDYPDLARKAGMEGMVVVQVIIGPDGTPRDPSIAKSVASVLDNAAIEAVMMQEFVPGRQRGRPVTVALNIPVTFRLTG